MSVNTTERDEREARLPLWARKLLEALRTRAESAERLIEFQNAELQARGEAAEATFDAATSNVSYETKYGVQHLEPGGTLLLGPANALELAVTLSDGGLHIDGLGGFITIRLVQSGGIQIGLEKR